MKKLKNRCLQPVLFALSLMAVCGSANAADNIVEVADKAGTFKTLLAAAKAAGLVDALQEDGPLTVFAPTDDAFAKLPSHTLNDLLKPENKEKLATILKYHVIPRNHVIPRKLAAKDLVRFEWAKTLLGDRISFSIRDGRLTVANANIIVNDVEASNGIIHVIDEVLLPRKSDIVATAEAEVNLNTFVAAVEAAGLAETLRGEGPFTVLAPSDKAFEKLPKGTIDSLLKPENKKRLRAILRYHVLPQRLSIHQLGRLSSTRSIDDDVLAVETKLIITINKSRVLRGDFGASNGVIHVIDQVLMPPAQPVDNIVETAAAAGNFKTLIAAVKAAGLVETLKGEGPFTVLAPSDEAFEKLPHGTVESLLKPENKHKLQAILKYHVLPGRQAAKEVALQSEVKSIAGDSISITSKYPLTFNKSKVVKPDIKASNGIIHVIDQVLMPPADSVAKEIFKSEFRLLQRLDPALESKLQSGHGPATTVTFCNLSSTPIQVYWIDSQGKRKKWRGLIEPGALEICDRSFATHLWLIADEHEKGLGLYVLDSQDGLIVHK